MASYKMTESEDCECRYGIEAHSGRKSLRYDCVTADRAAMETLVGLCNEYNLEICHLGDILEDFLTDFCI